MNGNDTHPEQSRSTNPTKVDSFPIFSIAGAKTYPERKPQSVPTLGIQSSYKSWNDKLRTLGFDFGSTFRNSNFINTDGVSYTASADICIKQECGLIKGESRYIVHPTILDSCLQTSVMALHKGDLDTVTCGTVLTHFDEVTIWAPTRKQMENFDATATCWTKERGIRTSICDAQIVAHDGELIADFEGFQCSAYEAAKLRDSQELQKDLYTKTQWEMDLDYLNHSLAMEAMPQTTLRRLFEIFLHKDAAIQVLIVGAEFLEYLPNERRPLHLTVAANSDEETENLQKAYSTGESLRIISLDTLLSRDGKIADLGTFDLMIYSPNARLDNMLVNREALLNPRAHIITFQDQTCE